MAKQEKTFDECLLELEKIVAKLEQGDVPLEEALTKFQEGITLSRDLKKTLEDAEKTLAKVVTEDGNEEILVFFHFPPVFNSFVCEEIVEVLLSYGIKRCYFGHIHGVYNIPRTVNYRGISFSIVSADYLDFVPMIIV